MASAEEIIKNISDQLTRSEEVPNQTVRAFLAWFGMQRRSYWNVFYIRKVLRENRIDTFPDFEGAYIDSEIAFRRSEESVDDSHQPESNSMELPDSVNATLSTGVSVDPTYRLRKLEAANKAPVSVKPDDTVAKAVTIMLANDFSQLPVMTGERTVLGMVSLQGIGIRHALGKCGNTVREVMDIHQELRADTSMFQAIYEIGQRGYVLVRESDNRISGIITASDLNHQFKSLAEPFLLLGEIENQIRSLIYPAMALEQINNFLKSTDRETIAKVSDLTFGGYVSILQNEANWVALGIPLDRASFCNFLDEVREIRNDVTHFDPDGIPAEDLEKVRRFAQLLQGLRSLSFGKSI